MHTLDNLSAALQTYGSWGIFGLALLDSVGFPLPSVTDVILLGIGIKAIHTPSHAYFAALMAIFGSLAGNAILFHGARQGRRLLTKREAEPGKFQAWFRRYGLLTVFVPAVVPFVPLPLKVFVISAGALRTSFAKFMAVIAAARVIRYFGLAYVALQLGADARGFFTRNGWTLVGGAIGLVFLLYLAMRWAEGRRPADTPIS
jgi:membrane protein YqaA with SNARE-associated domain